MDMSDVTDFLLASMRSIGAEVTSPWFYLQLGLMLAGAGVAFGVGAAVRSRVDVTSLAMGWPAPIRMLLRVIVRSSSVAAFALPGDDVERLIILAERADGATEEGDAPAEDAIRSAVTNNHGISPEVVEFRAPGGVARSTAGKIARRVNAKQFTEREHAAAE